MRYLNYSAENSVVALLAAGLCLVGCGKNYPPLPAFDEPSLLGERAMESLDANRDNMLSADELQSSAGLASALKRLDTNGDSKLSRQELQSRLDELANMSDILSPTVFVSRSGVAEAEARVELRLDPWQGDDLPLFVGLSSARGRCILEPERGELPGVPKGFYTVSITPAGDASPVERGCEVADDVNSRELSFELSKRVGN